MRDPFVITTSVSCYRDPNVPEEMQEEDGLLYEYHVYERLHDGWVFQSSSCQSRMLAMPSNSSV